MTKEKIDALARLSKKEDIMPAPVRGSYDPMDYAPSEPILIGKRLAEYFSFQKGEIEGCWVFY